MCDAIVMNVKAINEKKRICYFWYQGHFVKVTSFIEGYCMSIMK